MKVRVVSYSQEPTPDAGTPLDLVAYCARVSNPANQNNKKTAKKLVDYLIKHKHWSPLEMVNVCMENPSLVGIPNSPIVLYLIQ